MDTVGNRRSDKKTLKYAALYLSPAARPPPSAAAKAILGGSRRAPSWGKRRPLSATIHEFQVEQSVPEAGA